MAPEAVTDDQVSQSGYAAVRCHGDSVPHHCCGVVEIDEQEYTRQMMKPDALWMCPKCGSTASFDDEYFERVHNLNETLPDEEPDELYERVKALVRTHGTDAVRGVCDTLEAEAREGNFGG
jgi:hypothetical protein